MFRYLSIKEADAFLIEKGLFRDSEPCVLIAHAFINALDGSVDEAVRTATELVQRFGLVGTTCATWVLKYVRDLATSARNSRESSGALTDHVIRAYAMAQSVEAMTSIENRRGTACELGLACECALVRVLEYPVELFVHFAKWKDPTKPNVPSGSEWARFIYGQIFQYEMKEDAKEAKVA